MIKQILNNLRNNLQNIILKMGVSDDFEIMFEVPRDKTHGDYSTNVAMKLAKYLKKAPGVIANEIVQKIDIQSNHLEKCEVAGSGFINFYISRKYLLEVITKINEEQSNYGNLKIGDNTKVLIEFVSANPTGYLHIGHCRGAAYGDSLARILKKAGYVVSKEHYVNDAGNQINNLAYSIYERYKELFGQTPDMKDDYYHGQEIKLIAEKIKEEHQDKFLNSEWYNYFRNYGVEYLLAGLKRDLSDFNVEFDTWFSEKSLYDNDDVNKTLQYLIEHDHTYEEDGAVWLKTIDYGDEKNRVLVKSDKTFTYLMPDIAYHANKLSRGYDLLIDVLGADHHGYINRLKAAIAYVGGNPDLIDVEILQMVRVIKDGEELKMSKRSGKAITMRDLIDEVGADALRFMFVSKSLSTHMDLDLDLAIKKTNENPVYYVQYAYARIASIFRKYPDDFQAVKQFNKVKLDSIEELLFSLLQYPSVIEEASEKKIPHKICQYAINLASQLHSYYNDEKIITEDKEETNEKLTILKAVQIVLKDALALVGVDVKEEM